MTRLNSIGAFVSCLFAFAAVSEAGSVIQSSTFGNSRRLSSDGTTIQGWKLGGEDYVPELLSDRVILTPPFAGNKRGSLWATEPVTQEEWSAELVFRANGEERGDGNLQLWFVKDGPSAIRTSSIYNSSPFEGLAISVDMNSGRGSVRGFLNDGTTDFKSRAGVDTLAFGRCDYTYRNLGRPSRILVKHTSLAFEVVVDGSPCFKTPKVYVPPGKHFGITAVSAEDPDSFEVFRLQVENVDESEGTRSNAARAQRNYEAQHRPNQGNPNANSNNNNNNNNNYNRNSQPSADTAALESQVRDLARQLQDLTTMTKKTLDEVFAMSSDNTERMKELGRTVANRNQISGLESKMQHLERKLEDIQTEAKNRDFSRQISKLQDAMQRSHSGLLEHLQDSSSKILSSAPRMGLFIFFIIAVQLALAVSYIWYKQRRAHMPKKYL